MALTEPGRRFIRLTDGPNYFWRQKDDRWQLWTRTRDPVLVGEYDEPVSLAEIRRLAVLETC